MTAAHIDLSGKRIPPLGERICLNYSITYRLDSVRLRDYTTSCGRQDSSTKKARDHDTKNSGSSL
jgi:hypothetical protein